MNEEAQRIGMTDSHFSNANGLHDSEQFVTARDLALLARRLVTEFPDFAPVFSIPALQAGDKVHYSYNLLLERFPGADGMKTGFVCASGYNIVASATREGRQVIAVVLGAFSQSERAERAAQLLQAAFSRDSGGVAIERFMSGGQAAPARSQRDTMCSETARKTRYDPGAGDAVVESAFLTPRRITRSPEPISTGGISAPPSEAVLFAQYVPGGDVPVPVPRPDHTRYDVDGLPVSGYAPSDLAIPVPTPRPE
jgi:D-alanyl-D-alanine carboxypeptidase